jgi:hypothetical protein
VAEQGSPPPPSGRLPTAGGRDDARATGRHYWDEPAETDEEQAPWAGPGVTPRWAGQEARQRGAHAHPGAPETGRRGRPAARDDAQAPDAQAPAAAGLDGDDRAEPGWATRPGPGSRSRKAAARSRRRSRITWVWGGAAVAVAVIVAGVVYVLGGNQAAPSASDGFVTTFQHGEFKTVPNACTAVTSATLNQYLPGKRRMVAPHSLDGSAQSLCNWTLDAPPVYRVLEVNVQAYSPSGLATGNGSATNAATDAYQQDLRTMHHPLRATHLPAATVTALHGLGTTAFAALQVVQARGVSTDLETVVARDHNVVVTVVVQGPHARSGRYHAAPQSELQSGALASATDVVHGLH